MPGVTESEPQPVEETPEEKRARVMARLAEIIKADPPDLSGAGSGPVTAGGLPALPTEADSFDQESAAQLLATLGDFFRRTRNEDGPEAGPEGSERE